TRLISCKGTGLSVTGVSGDKGSTERAIYSLNLFIAGFIFLAVNRIQYVQLLAKYIDLCLQVAYHSLQCQFPIGALRIFLLQEVVIRFHLTDEIGRASCRERV